MNGVHFQMTYIVNDLHLLMTYIWQGKGKSWTFLRPEPKGIGNESFKAFPNTA